MVGDEVVLEAARAIRFYLPDLTGPGAEGLDEQLASLLAAAGRGELVVERLLDVLDDHPATHSWVAGFLEYQLPPEAVETRERYAGLPGHGEVTRAPRFLCPSGDFSWYRTRVGLVPPRCPTHGFELARAEPQQPTC